MKTIFFDAHLIELNDISYVQDHVEEQAPCMAYFKITYPQGNDGYFMAAADKINYVSVAISREAYEIALRVNQ